jgi:hypothetical protein
VQQFRRQDTERKRKNLCGRLPKDIVRSWDLT